MTNELPRHITIVGGGITGLSAAFYLTKAIQDNNLPIRFTLIEASERLGGKIQTERRDGFVIERGPDSFLARKKSAAQLVTDVGLSDQLVRNETGQAYVLQKNRLLPTPPGAVMGIPTKFTPFATSPLISPAGKLRALFGDVLLPRSPVTEDQSAGYFFRRRLGDDIVDRLIEPLLSGIYAGNIDNLSLMATFPQFYHLEQQYRSLMIGMKKTRPPATNRRPQGAFLTLKQGLQSLVEAIVNELPPSSIMRNSTLTRVEKTNRRYLLYVDEGKTIETDAVIFTVPHEVTGKIFADVPIKDMHIETVPTSVATVALAFEREHIDIPYDGTGFVVPRTSPYDITACTWTHKKWPHTTPEGKVLIRSYVGRAGDEAIVQQADESIINTVIRDLHQITPIKGDPLFYNVTRWLKGMPQYAVGHNTWLKRVREQFTKHLPGVYLAGAPYEGVGLPDCIDQGKKAVTETIEYVKSR